MEVVIDGDEMNEFPVNDICEQLLMIRLIPGFQNPQSSGFPFCS